MDRISRAGSGIGRCACPWGVARFIDQRAERPGVPAGDVPRIAAVTGAILHDVPGLDPGHREDRCRFGAVAAKDPFIARPPDRLAQRARAADCGESRLPKAAAGLPACSNGLSLDVTDDHEVPKAGVRMSGARCAGCADTPPNAVARCVGSA